MHAMLITGEISVFTESWSFYNACLRFCLTSFIGNLFLSQFQDPGLNVSCLDVERGALKCDPSGVKGLRKLHLR